MRALGLFHVLFGAEAHIHQWFKASSLPSVLEKYKQQNQRGQSCKCSSNCGSNHDSPHVGFFKWTWKYEMSEVRTAHDFTSQITWKKENIPQPDNYDYFCGLETHWPQGKLVMHRVTNTHTRARDASCQTSLQLNLNFNLSYKLKYWEWERLTLTRQKDHSLI